MLPREANHRERHGSVQRREGLCGLELPEDPIVDEAMLPERGTSMHDAMPDGVRCRHPRGGKARGDAGDGFTELDA